MATVHEFVINQNKKDDEVFRRSTQEQMQAWHSSPKIVNIEKQTNAVLDYLNLQTDASGRDILTDKILESFGLPTDEKTVRNSVYDILEDYKIEWNNTWIRTPENPKQAEMLFDEILDNCTEDLVNFSEGFRNSKKNDLEQQATKPTVEYNNQKPTSKGHIIFTKEEQLALRKGGEVIRLQFEHEDGTKKDLYIHEENGEIKIIEMKPKKTTTEQTQTAQPARMKIKR
jgi:hypothetical protein